MARLVAVVFVVMSVASIAMAHPVPASSMAGLMSQYVGAEHNVRSSIAMAHPVPASSMAGCGWEGLAAGLMSRYVGSQLFEVLNTAGGSWAAGLMSEYVGAVPAGSQLFEVLQSVNTAGQRSAAALAERSAAALAACSEALESVSNQDEKTRKKWCAAAFVAVSGVTVAGLATAPVTVPAIVKALGFGSSGIEAGSWAAGLMSSYAGTVPAGSLCAVLQSVGAAGLAPSTIAVMESAAAAVAAGSAVIGSQLLKEMKQLRPAIKSFDASCPCK